MSKNTKLNLIAGSMLASFAISLPATAANNDMFAFSDLGSGSELRAELNALSSPFAFGEIDTDKFVAMNCGKTDSASTKTAKESKCGKKAKKAEKDKKKASDKKAKEGSCGGGC